MRRAATVAFAGAVALAGTALAAAQAPGQLPLEPVRESGQSVTGAYEGWYPNPDGSSTLLVGYFNRNQKETLEIPIGPDNRIEPGGPDQGQPTHFLPRRQWGVFTIRVPNAFGDRKLTWTLRAHGQTTTVTMHLDPLWIVTPLREAGVGNTPPAVRFTPAGATFQGPPVGIAHSLTASVSRPVGVSVWVTDDGIRPPEARPREGPQTTVSWSTFRGPGLVTIAKASPVSDSDGMSTAVVTFGTPGEYILRVQVNDASGEGGGGFQCCWTSAHVRVAVE
jgi:hypothetical protein